MEVDLASLRATTNLLQTLLHRNRNQHRRSLWWKWAGILKRFALRFLNASETDRLRLLQSNGSYLRGVILPKCYVSFSQLVADSQYASLGIVLLAELASVQRAMSVRELSGTGYPSKVQKTDHVTGHSVDEDRGQHVKRTVLTDSKAKPAAESTSGNVRQSQTPIDDYYGSKPTGQSRRKISNAIDDLFEG
ncbi:MAG: hypothetical protein Q9214_002623, partial [Letrouitia sp. 1 TL-2023]